MTTIVTHVSPDWDALGAVWLLKRFYAPLVSADVLFVNTGNPDPDVLASANAVVDTGREYDPNRLRFDHHQLPGQAANDTCATEQVYSFLTWRDVDAGQAHRLDYLIPLSNMILCGDTGRKEDGAYHSRLVGIHALLSAQKAKHKTDVELLDYGFTILDDIAASLLARSEAARTLAQHKVYESEDGLVVALHNAPQGATFAAHEAGARLVVFYTESPNVPTYARGILRAGEWQEPHVGKLIDTIIGNAQDGVAVPVPMFAELINWYKHEAGFFAGKGTAKAPCTDPMLVDIRDIAVAIDETWQR